ncbi:hypothetical protein GOODEAATRI_022028 [Goodea atripinnis]|uniref:Uncharacterized protein n=1 Tax=Goodea atripinnis TaxID=208336 RepID=A0ABV0Q0P2_9TELE
MEDSITCLVVHLLLTSCLFMMPLSKNRISNSLSFMSVFQVPDQSLSLTAADSGLVSALQPSQTLLSLFLSSPDEETVSGTGVILSFSSTGQTPPACDTSTGTSTRWRLQYDVYQYFLPENDLSESSLFAGIQAVADIRGMMASGRLVLTLKSTDKTTMVFSSIPGQGVIYSVIVRDPVLKTSASYVPAHTYACSFASTLDGCQTLG